MSQLTLDNIETQMCPRCKLGLKCESIIDDTVTYFCPTCLKDFTFTVCLNCGIIFETNGYKSCSQCRKQAFNVITHSKEKEKTILIIGGENDGE